MWFVAIVIIALVLLKPKLLSEAEGKILPASSVPPIVPVSSKPPEGSVQEIAQIQKDKPTQENFLENPALRMMAGQVANQIKNVVVTGSMQAPADIGSALLTMFSGDIQTGGQIGATVGAIAAPIVSSVLSTTPDLMGIATVGGDVVMGEEAMVEAGAAPIGSLGFALGFPLMVLGQMIGGLLRNPAHFLKHNKLLFLIV